ncbi:MAG: pseudouridine synthase [Patescibacteria group bacterium]
MRINKYLALNKYSTRKGGDELVKKGKVFINGRVAVLGDKVNQNDKVDVKSGAQKKNYVYFAYNKPKGVITHSPQMGEKDIRQSVPLKNVFPVGRLDKASHGLIILTDDGRVTDRLLNPKYTHDKEYVVSATNKISPSFKNKLESGVNIGDYKTKKCKVVGLSSHVFKIILTEGKKHQIRRMCSALKNDVTDLKRIRIMNVHLGNLGDRQYREISGDELQKFLKNIGL